jgi:hypothetical protein
MNLTDEIISFISIFLVTDKHHNRIEDIRLIINDITFQEDETGVLMDYENSFDIQDFVTGYRPSSFIESLGCFIEKMNLEISHFRGSYIKFTYK